MRVFSLMIRFFGFVLGALFFFLIFVAPAFAYTIDIATTTNGSMRFGYSTTVQRERWAQQFLTGAAGSLDSILHGVIKTGSPTDNVQLALQADASGSPSGTDLAVASVAGSGLSGSCGSQTNFVYSSPPAVSAATLYWVVVRRSAAVSTSDYYSWCSLSPGLYTDGTTKEYTNGSWAAGGGEDAWMTLTISTTTPPSPTVNPLMRYATSTCSGTPQVCVFEYIPEISTLDFVTVSGVVVFLLSFPMWMFFYSKRHYSETV